MSRYVSVWTGLPVTPHPDDFCHDCGGRGWRTEYTGPGYMTTSARCGACDGTGWQGMAWAPREAVQNPEDAMLDRMAAQAAANVEG